MGLDLLGKKTDAYFRFSYSGFSTMRCGILFACNKEIGEAYDRLSYDTIDIEKGEIVNDRVQEGDWEKVLDFVQKEGNKGLANLILHSDCEGELSLEELKELYENIKDLNFKGAFEFLNNPEYGNKYRRTDSRFYEEYAEDFRKYIKSLIDNEEGVIFA